MPHVPSWAHHAGSLARDIYSSQSSRLPRRRGPGPNVLISQITSYDSSRPVPSQVNSDEIPIPTEALMHGVTDPNKVSEFNSAKPSAPTPVPAVHCHEWTPDSTFSISEITEFRNTGSVGDAPLPQLSWEPSPSEWYERTSTHILGMIGLMIVAIVLVEIYERIVSCASSKSSRRRGRGLQLEGRERSLYAEIPLYLEEKQSPQEEQEDEEEEKEKGTTDEELDDFWSV